MRRVAYEYILFWIQIVIITFFVLLLSAFYFKTRSSDFLENGLYSQNVRGIELKGTGEAQMEQLLGCAKGDITLIKHISDDHHLRRGYYCKEPNRLFPYEGYLAYGRFFSKADYEEKRRVAVIGSEVLADVLEKEGKRYYGYNGKEYEVIGEFRQTASDLDRMVYINLTSLAGTEMDNGIYYIDGMDSAACEKIEESLIKEIEGTAKIKYEHRQEDMNSVHKVKFLLAILAAFCNLTMISFYFAEKQNYKIAVFRLCGLSNLEIGTYYGKRLLLIAVSGYLCGCVGLYVVKNAAFVSFSQISNVHYLLTGGIVLFSVAVVAASSIRMLGKTDVSRALKGGC